MVGIVANEIELDEPRFQETLSRLGSDRSWLSRLAEGKKQQRGPRQDAEEPAVQRRRKNSRSSSSDGGADGEARSPMSVDVTTNRISQVWPSLEGRQYDSVHSIPIQPTRNRGEEKSHST